MMMMAGGGNNGQRAKLHQFDLGVVSALLPGGSFRRQAQHTHGRSSKLTLLPVPQE
jgi:hypothetical protein